MTSTGQDVELYKGNTRTLRITVKDGDGAAIDISDATVVRWWMGKNNKATGTDVYIKKSTHTGEGITLDYDGEFWVAVIGLTSDDSEDLTPGKFYHECEVVTVDDEVVTVAIGAFTLISTIIDPDLA